MRVFHLLMSVSKSYKSSLSLRITSLVALLTALIVLNGQGCGAGFELSSASLSSSDHISKTRFAKAYQVLQKKCISCHKAGGSAEIANFDFATEEEFLNSQWFNAGDVSSLSLSRTKGSGLDGANMPPANMPWTPGEYTILKDWIVAAKSPSSGPNISPAFVCNDPLDLGPVDTVRISKTQYINILTDLFGAEAVEQASAYISQIPEDYNSTGQIDVSSISVDRVDAYMNVAFYIANYVTNSSQRINSIFGSCATAASPSSNCINTYIGTTAQRILRRPLTVVEIEKVKSLINASESYVKGMTNVLAYHLQAPAFILRLELGVNNDQESKFSLSPYEVASRIAFNATDSGPDELLLAAAKNGQLATQIQVEEQVRRLFASAKGRVKIRRMFKHWLKQITNGFGFSNLPASMIGSTDINGIEGASISEMDKFIDYIIWDKNLGYNELLTSKISFANHAGLASVYGHSPVADSESSLFSGRRQGVLMRLPFLGWSRTRSNLVQRGIKFRRQVLCESLPGPSPEILQQRDTLEPTLDESLHMTTREYVKVVTDSPVCMSCHANINPTGFAFENFDSLGRIRMDENLFDPMGNFVRKLPLDTSESVPLWRGEKVDVNDGYDLITAVAKSNEAKACFAKQTFRFFHQRLESSRDACELNEIYKSLTKPNASILDAFVSSLANRVIGLRRK